MKKLFVMTMMALGVMGAMAAGPYLRPLGVEEMARFGATHAVTVLARDMTETTDSVAQTNTITLTGPVSWEFVGYRLDTPFDSSSNTNTVSVGLTVTLGSTTLVNGLQVGGDVFRTYNSFVPTSCTTVMSGLDATNTVTATVTWPYSGVVTNGATATITVIMGAPGLSAPLNLDELDTGQARTFLRLWQQ